MEDHASDFGNIDESMALLHLIATRDVVEVYLYIIKHNIKLAQVSLPILPIFPQDNTRTQKTDLIELIYRRINGEDRQHSTYKMMYLNI